MGRIFIGFIRSRRTRVGRIVARGVKLRYGCEGKVEN